MEPVNLSESKIYLIDAVKIFLFWILSKLDFPYRSKSVKAVSEKLEILILISLRSSKRVFWIFVKKWQCRKKCVVDSVSRVQVHNGFIQLSKLWLNLCSFKWLSPSLNLVRRHAPKGSQISYMGFDKGWILLSKWFLNTL